jgi:hypothetical protein
MNLDNRLGEVQALSVTCREILLLVDSLLSEWKKIPDLEQALVAFRSCRSSYQVGRRREGVAPLLNFERVCVNQEEPS